jgi:hypothetical protein
MLTDSQIVRLLAVDRKSLPEGENGAFDPKRTSEMSWFKQTTSPNSRVFGSYVSLCADRAGGCWSVVPTTDV